jgi:hypothetical protein
VHLALLEYVPDLPRQPRVFVLVRVNVHRKLLLVKLFLQIFATIAGKSPLIKCCPIESESLELARFVDAEALVDEDVGGDGRLVVVEQLRNAQGVRVRLQVVEGPRVKPLQDASYVLVGHSIFSKVDQVNKCLN